VIHKFEITADLDPRDAGELLFVLSQFIDERKGSLLRFFSETERGRDDNVFPLNLLEKGS